MSIKLTRRFMLLLWLWTVASAAFAPFVVKDIKIEGVHRVSASTVFSNFPLRAGDTVDSAKLAEATRSLYASGLFKDAVIERMNGLLILRLTEKPSISTVKFIGNNKMKDKDLSQAFSSLGLAPGKILNNETLERALAELEQQYIVLGRYDTKVNSRITPLVQNRVALEILVKEGAESVVSYVRFIGNRLYNSDQLAKALDMKPTKRYQIFGSSDKFSIEKLKADVELLNNFYQDRGYLDFKLVSHHVELAQNKKTVIVTYNMQEGKRYVVNNIYLARDSKISPKFLASSVKISKGEVFSRKRIIDSKEELASNLGVFGYAFSDIEVMPKKVGVNQIDLEYVIDPGRKTYVNRIHIVGNTKTRDEVIRRELRQYEGGRFSAKELERSTARLRRLGYFEQVGVKTRPVEGFDDKVDIIYNITEKSTGSIKLGMGYSRSSGVGLNFGLSQDNFLGIGKRFSLDVSTNDSDKNYSFNLYDPYFTRNGVSLGYGLFFRDRDTSDLNVASYLLDEYGGELDFGVPINEYDRIHLGTRMSRAEFTCGESFLECNDYIKEHGHGLSATGGGLLIGKLNVYDVFLRWSRNTRNRAIFPTSGMLQSFSLTAGLGDVRYEKFNYSNKSYIPLNDDFTLKLSTDLGYGYSRKAKDKKLPFFKKYYVGGEGSVRGFEYASLSPRSSNDSSRYLGGNLKTVFNMELINPIPFMSDNKSIKMVTFVDAGSAFAKSDDFDFGDIRVSAGLGVLWVSPVGPLSFSYAKPLIKKEGDEERAFQFQLGSVF